MERGMLTKRFLCEHPFVSGLDKEIIRNIHKSLRQDIRAVYSFANLEDNMLYTVVDSHDRLTVESFFSELRIPCNVMTEIELQCEGRGQIQDLRKVMKAA